DNACESPARPASPSLCAVQVGAFAAKRNAERVRASMERTYGSARVALRDGRPVQWRVLVGREATEESAETLAARIRGDKAAQATAAFVVRLDSETATDGL